MSDSIVLSKDEITALTGYEQATKSLAVLHRRGFSRAYINRKGEIVLERTHYESVTKAQTPQELRGSGKVANLTFLKQA